jgi:hypothetical protein
LKTCKYNPENFGCPHTHATNITIGDSERAFT